MVIKQVLVAVIAGLVLAASNSVFARGLEHSYADVGYQRINGDSVDYDSGLVDGVFGLYDFFALRGGFLRGHTDDFPDGNVDLTEFRAGIRLQYSVLKQLDLFGDALGFNAKLNGDSSSTDIGMIYEVGARYLALKKLELNASYKRVGGDLNKDFGTVGAVFKLTKSISLSAKAEINSDIENYFAGLRFNF